MNEIPQADGSSAFELSDSEYGVKTIGRNQGEASVLGDTWYRDGEIQS